MANVKFATVKFSGVKDGIMTSTNTINSDWVDIPAGSQEIGIEALWNGTPTGPTGTLSYDYRVGVFPKAMGLSGLDQPDGTVYAGDLDASATDLSAEALGSSIALVNGVNANQIRANYTNISGAGLLNVRFTFKFDADRVA